MNLILKGKVSFPAAMCEKCGESISLWVCPEKSVKCEKCGAVYVVVSSQYADQAVEFECVFSQFQCISKGISDSCANVCPAPGMYCKAHLTDDCYTTIRNSITFYGEVIDTA